MHLELLKIGNLMGTPDAKEMLHRVGPGSQAANALWNDIARIKTTFGYSGQCTSLLLTDPLKPEAFPVLIDPSFMTADGRPGAVERALVALERLGVDLGLVRSVLITHDHPDHFDPRLMSHLPHATVYSHPDAKVPGSEPFPEERFDGRINALATPGHGGPHTSYLFDQQYHDLAVCVAGDLIMDQAHYLDRNHPLSFSDPEQGLSSIEEVRSALAARGRKYSLVFPGHGLPFFLPEPTPV